MWQMECTVGAVNANVVINLILKNLFKHPHQIIIKKINFSILTKEKIYELKISSLICLHLLSLLSHISLFHSSLSPLMLSFVPSLSFISLFCLSPSQLGVEVLFMVEVVDLGSWVLVKVVDLRSSIMEILCYRHHRCYCSSLKVPIGCYRH